MTRLDMLIERREALREELRAVQDEINAQRSMARSITTGKPMRVSVIDARAEELFASQPQDCLPLLIQFRTRGGDLRWFAVGGSERAAVRCPVCQCATVLKKGDGRDNRVAGMKVRQLGVHGYGPLKQHCWSKCQ